MIPVMQSKLYPGAGHCGNCVAACHASLLEIPLWMVPPWEEMFGRGDHTSRMVEWFNKIWKMELIWEQGHPVDILPEFYIACGQSERNIGHAVIYSKGVMVHDPHYSGSGIKAVDSVYYLQPLDTAEKPVEKTPTGLLNIATNLLRKHEIEGKRAADFLFDFNEEVRA